MNSKVTNRKVQTVEIPSEIVSSMFREFLQKRGFFTHLPKPSRVETKSGGGIRLVWEHHDEINVEV